MGKLFKFHKNGNFYKIARKKTFGNVLKVQENGKFFNCQKLGVNFQSGKSML